jgi:hypothetical protein
VNPLPFNVRVNDELPAVTKAGLILRISGAGFVGDVMVYVADATALVEYPGAVAMA